MANVTPKATIVAADPAYAAKIRMKFIEDLKPFGRRARVHTPEQLEAIAASIKQFGFNEPVVIDDKDQVLVGYGRIAAAQKLGLTEAPTILISHLTDEEKRAYIIAANRTAELASWNRSVLALELQELNNLGLSFNLDVTGFKIQEREALIFGKDSGSTEEDQVPQLPSTPVSRVGDLWDLGEHRLYHGDALKAESYEALLEGQRAQGAFLDPPFNVPVQGHITRGKAHGEFVMAAGELTKVEFAAFLATCAERQAEVLEPGAVGFCCMDWRSIAPLICAFEGVGLEILNVIVWSKPQAGNGSLWRSQHELIVAFKKPGASHTNNVELGRNGRNRSNVWSYPGVIGLGDDKAHLRSLHPTPKPVNLIKDALLDCTRPGDLICDGFAGSGSVALACEQIGRRARLIELDPRYVDVAICRWQDFTGKTAVHRQSGQPFRKIAGERARSGSAPPVRSRRRVVVA